MDAILKRGLAGGALLIIVVVVSLLLYLFRPVKTVQRVLFFPDETTLLWRGELRELPSPENREEEIEYVLREIVLGPTHLQLGRAVPRNTGIGSVLYRDETLFIDLSQHMVFPDEEMLIDFYGMLSGIKKTIEYNYPRIEDIRFFVDGAVVEG